ncbi:uncharacterized protein si:dkey-250d21.1 isoform X2 [Electrophorus electricus]|uniref:uncharacterized protein si:dkey-250d21.1 isoform X2 n=1 Tax=Electrophorus electricus TaxID=8005 RepID=UPI0015D03EA2|nr:uncharacterized protein si:dkey-250d21.1 isoform X2 [Electrophorus electricus]
MPDCCAAANCKQSTDQANVSFFRFPLDPERCKQWVGNCRRPDLQTKTPEYLHRNFKLCSKHFEVSMIHRESELKCVLKDGAVPTIFDFTTNKDNAQNSSRKRARPPAAGHPVEAKKAKDDPQATVVRQILSEDPADNSAMQDPAQEDLDKEDPATSKAKETLKVYFKETLAFTGFSIGNNAAISATKSMGSGPVGQLGVNPVCAEKIESKEVLKLGEDVMCEEIRNSLRMARFFSILLQDKTNIEGKDQIPVFVRSVTSDGFPQKHLMGFLPCDVDSDCLFLMLVSEIRGRWGLRMEHCRGFTYLTTGSLCQKLKELSCRILRDFPQVVLAPSDPYAFNLWLIRSLPVLSIQDVVDTVEEVAALLRQSSTLTKKLHAKITVAYSHIKGEVDRVKDACQNNWEYGTDAFQTMLDILEPLLNSIGEMCTSALSDVDTAIVEQLLKLKEKLKNFNFIMTLVVLKNTLCCVSILNPSLRGIISISSTLQYTISNALKLLSKHLQEIPIFHRKWFSDAVGRAKKLGVAVTLPADTATNGDAEAKPPPSPEDYYRDTLSKMTLQYLIDEVKRVLGTEMVRILRWLSLVPSYMADHNFSIRKDKVADANLNNLARPDSFYDELGCWEVKWRHASKRRILPTTVFATLKIPDIGFYPNVQSLLRVLGSIPCINADADVYGQYDMVLDRYHSYMREVPAEMRLCNMAFVYVNQDVHFSIEDMVQSYVDSHPDILQLLHKDDMMDIQPSAENSSNDVTKEDTEEPQEMTLDMELERPKAADCTGTDKETLKSALQAAITAACCSRDRTSQGSHGGEVEYVTKSEMNEVLEVCEGVVREGILSEVGNSFFSLFVDRAVRFGEMDLLPLFLRFVDSFDVMRLELMGFVDVNLDTEAMCERLFDIVVKEWRLNLKYCRGQAYLGSGEVSYKLKAFACKVQEKYPLAICTHSSCYSFNTWWSRSVPVPSVSRALDTLEKIVVFFSSTADLEKQLDQIIAIGLRENYEKVHELQGMFCSSWLEKHDSYDVFAQILEPIADSLERFQCSSPQIWSLAVINQAKKLVQLIRDFDFIVAMVALKNVSSFTKELSAALQKDHFSAASQLCQISGIVATLNRVKTNIKVFHQNWFDEACAFAQSLGVPIKVPDSVTVPRDSLLKPGTYYKDAVSLPLVDHLINSVKDHFSDDHKEALNFLSLVPCSVTVSYTFESLKSKPPLYVSDLPDPDNFFTELSCWKVKWKTKVVSPTIPDTIFQTLRLPLMQYFANINTLLKIMCVLPSTALEYCGEVKHHKMFEDYLRNTCAKDRSPCLAVLQVGTNFNRDLDRMVAQCLKVTPKTLEGICLDKESKTLLRNSEVKVEDNHKDEVEEMDTQQIFSQIKSAEMLPESSEIKTEDNHSAAVEEMEAQRVSEMLTEVAMEERPVKPLDERAHLDRPVDSLQSSGAIFGLAVRLARRNCLLSELPKEEQDLIIEELRQCPWEQQNVECLSDMELSESIVKSIRETILSEVQESPFFSVITDKMVLVDDEKYIPVFVRYVDDCMPKVELLGFLPFDGSSDPDAQAKILSDILSEDWGLQMGFCRGQSFMCMGAGSQSLRKMALGFLESYPLAVNTPSESCGLAYWLAVSLHNEAITKVLGVVEDLLLFFDQSPRLHIELSQTMEGLLNTPREALAEVPETCLSRWKKTEDFFDILVDMLEGALSCLDSVSNNTNGSWSNSMSIHALILSTAIRESDFVIPLVILKNACAPLRNCSTVFRCGNPADIICELEKIPLIVESLSKMLENISVVHVSWFEEATQLAVKVAGALSYPETLGGCESLEVAYRETVSIPVLSGLIEEMKFNFSECHLRALRVLSLLPTCNPLPILPEASEKIYTIYQSDLPEPDKAEEDINTWASAWQEKHQDTSPPASISETLLHPEAKGHPNVTALLKLVAVLPSVSMECDLMKTTLNSLRTFLKNDNICRASKTTTVMLLMHRQTLQTLEEVVDKCMESDPKSHGFLSHVKQCVSNMREDSELGEVASQERATETQGSGASQEAKGLAPAFAQNQPGPTTQCDVGEPSSSALNDATGTPEDYVTDTNASSSTETIQCPPVDMADLQTVTLADDTHKDSSAVSPSYHAAGGQELSMEPHCIGQDVLSEPVTSIQGITMELSVAAQGTTMEPVTEMAGQSVTREVDAAAEDVTMELAVAAQSVTTEPVTEQGVTTEPVTATEDVPAAVQTVTTELARVIATQGVAAPLVTEMATQGVVTGLTAAAEDVPTALTAAVPYVTTEPETDMTGQDVTTEPITEIEAQSFNTEPLIAVKDVMIELTAAVPHVTTVHVTEIADLGVTTEPVIEKAAQGVATEPVTAAEEVTLAFTAPVQNVTKESVTEMPIESVTVVPVTAAEDITMEFTEAVESVTTEPVTEMAVQGITTEPVAAAEDVATELLAAQLDVTTELVPEVAAKGAAIGPGVAMDVVSVVKDAIPEVSTANQSMIINPVKAAQDVASEYMMTEQAATAERIMAPLAVTTEVATRAQEETQEHVAASEDFSMEVISASQDASLEATKEDREQVYIETGVAMEPTSDDSVTQHVTSSQYMMQVTTDTQDISMQPITEDQYVTSECTTASLGPATEATADQGVTLTAEDQTHEHITGSQDNSMVINSSDQVVFMEPMKESTEHVIAAAGVAINPPSDENITHEHVTAFQATSAAQDVSIEPIKEASCVLREHITASPCPSIEPTDQGVTQTAQNVAQEHVTVYHDVSMENISEQQDHDAFMAPLKEVQGVTIEHRSTEDAAEKHTAAQGGSTELVTSAQGGSTELVTSAQGGSTGPETAAQGAGPDPETAAQGAGPEPTNASQLVPLEHASEIVSVAIVHSVVGQNNSTKPREDLQDVTMETRDIALLHLTETITAVHDVTMESTSGYQSIIIEPPISNQCDTLKPTIEVSVKSLTPVPDITTKPAEGLSCTTEPLAAIQDINMESVTAEQSITAGSLKEAEGVNMDLTQETQESIVMTHTDTTELIVAARDVTEETVSKSKHMSILPVATVQAVVVEPVIQTQGVSAAPIVESRVVNTEAEKGGQDVPMCPATGGQDVPMCPATGGQDVPMCPATGGQDVPMCPATGGQDVPMCPSTGGQDVPMCPATGGQDVPMCPATGGQDVPMCPATGGQDVPMCPATGGQDVPMCPATGGQDVPMCPATGGQDVPMCPATGGQDVPMCPATGGQDVPMCPATGGQDVPMCPATGGQDVSESMATAHGSNPQTKDVTSQDMAAAVGDRSQIQVCPPDEASPTGQDGMDPLRDDVQDGADSPIPETQAAISQAPTVSQSDADHSTATSVETFTEQDNIIVHDVSQSYAIVQDGKAHPKAIRHAVGQGDFHQPVVVAHENIVAPKGTLSFYNTAAQAARRRDLENSRLFSIIFEEQIQIGGHPYIPVGICYLDKHETLCEDILAFVPLDKDVAVFVDAITAALAEKWGLNLAFCRGQSLLSVGATGAQMRAAASLLSRRYPPMRRTLDAAVSLNMWLGRSSVVTEMAENFKQVEKLLRWVSDNAERQANLRNQIMSTFEQDEKKGIELSDKLIGNQWENSHDMLELTVEVLEAVVLFLVGMKESGDNQAEKTQAVNFLSICQNFEFILTVVIMKNILSPTKNVSQSLQGGPLEMYQAVNSLPELLSFLNDMIVNIDSHFQAWFQEAVEVASKLQISVHHVSQEHYREAVSRGAIEHSVSEITEVLSDHVQSVLRCMQVVPYVISKTEGCCKDADHFTVYRDDLPDWNSLQVELLKWREKWLDALSTQQPQPSSVLGTLKVPDVGSFPNVETLLRLLVVLPCCRREGLIGQGKKTFLEFVQSQRSLPLLHPL